MENNTEENKKNNNLFLIITLVVVVALAIFWFTKFNRDGGGLSTNPVRGEFIEVDKSEIISSGEFCFVHFEMKEADKDLYALQIAVSEDGETRGSLTTSPAEKDTKTGNIYGQITEESDGKYFKGWYENTSEGIENTEQLFIKIEDEKAVIAFGEMQQSENVYIYKNPNSVNYNLEIPAVFCGTYGEIMSM